MKQSILEGGQIDTRHSWLNRTNCPYQAFRGQQLVKPSGAVPASWLTKLSRNTAYSTVYYATYFHLQPNNINHLLTFRGQLNIGIYTYCELRSDYYNFEA